ncbi:MAG: deoxyribonuclease IV [Phycisphaera sp.]|nr:deoxyribonuclease IV [Phycisphaera sp.]
MFGSHLSVAGGLHLALEEARRLDMQCVQVFTKNQRQWTAPPLTDEQVARWKSTLTTTGLATTVSHDSYLINLASPSPENLKKSLTLFRDELERCETLGIPHLVTHPGAHMKEGEEAGLARIVQSLDTVHKELPGYKTVTCLEVTAGQGTTLGYRFEHLRTIIDSVRDPQRLAVCLDTAHMLAAGYDLTGASACSAVLDELDRVLGVGLVHVLHVNDSKTPLGSRVDRHEHIGQGHISLDAFAVLMNHPHFRAIPKILETPKEDAPDGRPWDTVNIQTLRSLMTEARSPGGSPPRVARKRKVSKKK